MFEITPYDKILLTLGDTASFNCELVDLDGKERTPQDGDVLTFYIDDIDFEKVATNGSTYTFNFSGADFEGIEAGVYTYRIVLTTADDEQYTIFQDCFIDLLSDKSTEESEEPQYEP